MNARLNPPDRTDDFNTHETYRYHCAQVAGIIVSMKLDTVRSEMIERAVGKMVDLYLDLVGVPRVEPAQADGDKEPAAGR